MTVNRYERDPAARKKCLATYGHKCTVCDVDFETQYGDIGKDFIHVHHLKDTRQVAVTRAWADGRCFDGRGDVPAVGVRDDCAPC